MLAETHIHSPCEVSSFGADNCDETVLGIDATKGFLKITGLSPSLSSYAAKAQTQMEAVGRLLGGKGPLNVGADWLSVPVIFPSSQACKERRSTRHRGNICTHTPHACTRAHTFTQRLKLPIRAKILWKIFCY